jgi:quinol monooxygenase YgiN
MAAPIIFISRNKIKAGRLEEFRAHYQASIEPTIHGKPGTLAQLGYESDGAREFTVIRLFSDAEAFDQQLMGADQRSKKTYEFIEPFAVEIFGAPSEFALEMMRKVAGSGISVSVHPYFNGGFIRPGG